MCYTGIRRVERRVENFLNVLYFYFCSIIGGIITFMGDSSSPVATLMFKRSKERKEGSKYPLSFQIFIIILKQKFKLEPLTQTKAL